MDITHISAGFMFLSTLVSITLLAIALRAYREYRERSMLFLAAAFTVFTVKSVLVGTSLLFNLVAHESLELVDAMGDLATILLIVAPLFFMRE